MYQFMRFGWLIGGPFDVRYVGEEEKIGEAIDKLAEEDNAAHPGPIPYDSDDYTVTALYSYVWRGNIDSLPKNFAPIERINEFLKGMPE